MNVHLVDNFPRRSFDVYIFDGVHRRFIWRLKDGGAWAQEDFDERSREVEPSFTLPRDVLEELVRAAEGHVHAGDATVGHLKDAIVVRDRLLTLVEKSSESASGVHSAKTTSEDTA